jgi:hypothetical protein
MPIQKIAFEAIKIAIRQDRNGYVLNLAIHPHEVPEDLLRSPVGTRYMVGMAEFEQASFEAEQDIIAIEDYGKKIVKKAAIICRRKSFINWIGVENEVQASIWLKSALKINSRSELRDNLKAQAAFVELMEEFEDSINGEDDGEEAR